jgi:hypothetical protein
MFAERSSERDTETDREEERERERERERQRERETHTERERERERGRGFGEGEGGREGGGCRHGADWATSVKLLQCMSHSFTTLHPTTVGLAGSLFQ